jgi:catalase
VANVVPGIDFTNDPLLQGRIFSYLDTQLLRLGGPNFHEIPINASVNQVHNNQRDGFHRKAIHRGRVAYEPNSLGGGCPFQAGSRGFVSFPEPFHDDKLRGKPEKFADHYTQAKLFWASQSEVEQRHIINAFRFELTRVQTHAVRERVVAQLENVDLKLASGVAQGLGIELPPPLPRLLESPQAPEVEVSPALSLFSRPTESGIVARRVAILAGDGVDGDSAGAVYDALATGGATPRFVGQKLGFVTAESGDAFAIEVTIEAAPSVLFDAVVVTDGLAVEVLANDGNAVQFVKDAYRHCKPILALGSGAALLDAAGVPEILPDGRKDPGLIVAATGDAAGGIEQFFAALERHRTFERETDPPRI